MKTRKESLIAINQLERSRRIIHITTNLNA